MIASYKKLLNDALKGTLCNRCIQLSELGKCNWCYQGSRKA
jgi:recombinational DNA repair protein RecR